MGRLTDGQKGTVGTTARTVPKGLKRPLKTAFTTPKTPKGDGWDTSSLYSYRDKVHRKRGNCVTNYV